MLRKVLSQICFQSSHLKIPIVDIQPFLKGKDCPEQCKTVADAFYKFGCLIIKDPRVNQKENSDFIDMMQKMFSKRAADYYAGRQIQDVFPQHDYEVGLTPEFVERVRLIEDQVKQYTPENKSMTPIPPPFDAKWKYLWNIGDPVNTMQNQSPKDFPEWQTTMNSWGDHMIDGCMTISEMAAIGFGLQRNSFTKMLTHGPHKLGPTGSNLVKFDVGTVLVGFHYDFNFMTIHGKSRYPGLISWLRTGERFTVQVPEGHLLIQAGRQMQYLTGGYVVPAFHEVIYTEGVKEARDKAIKEGRIPWRVSSNLFAHIRYGEILKPLGSFGTEEANKKYPAVDAKQYVYEEIDYVKYQRYD